MKPSPIVSKETWPGAHEAPPAKEEATRARDALAAERRRQLRRNCETPFGRQETWDSPSGYPQIPPYEWWRSHDAYGEQR